MATLKPVWVFKVRKTKSVKGNVEKTVKIPDEIRSIKPGDYVQITIENGKIVIEPLDDNDLDKK